MQHRRHCIFARNSSSVSFLRHMGYKNLACPDFQQQFCCSAPDWIRMAQNSQRFQITRFVRKMYGIYSVASSYFHQIEHKILQGIS